MGCPGPPRLVLMLESLPRPTQSSYKNSMLEAGSSLAGHASGRGCLLRGPPGLTYPKCQSRGEKTLWIGA